MSDLKALTRLALIIEEFRKINPEMPMQSAMVLAIVARKPGISFRELGELAGLTRSSVSRVVTSLSKEYGQGLLDYREDPMDRRSKVAKLTPQGDRLIGSLLSYLDKD